MSAFAICLLALAACWAIVLGFAVFCSVQAEGGEG